MTAKNLGDILLEQGVIDQTALDRALQLQNRRLGEILIEEKLADPVAIANALKFQARFTTPQRSNRLFVEARALEDLLLRLEAIEDELATTTKRPVALNSLRNAVETLLIEPVETLLKKAEWIAARSATELHKKISFSAEGGGLVIDRSLIDDLSDIILHLVRNAADHGIESPETRLANGKPAEGTVHLQLSLSEGKLVFSLTDDGRGIDDEKVFARALATGLIKKTRAETTAEELHKFLFTPGFSTAEVVTASSGRGVGLDVVEATVIRLGGDVKVESKKGKGCTFSIRVPLHYARLSVVPLRVGKEWIAVNAADIATIEESSANVSGALQPSSLFKDEHQTSSATAALAIMTDGTKWTFDEVGQPELVLVRETSAFAKGSHGVVGSARLSTGQNVLLIDLGLLKHIATANA